MLDQVSMLQEEEIKTKKRQKVVMIPNNVQNSINCTQHPFSSIPYSIRFSQCTVSICPEIHVNNWQQLKCQVLQGTGTFLTLKENLKAGCFKVVLVLGFLLLFAVS